MHHMHHNHQRDSQGSLPPPSSEAIWTVDVPMGVFTVGERGIIAGGSAIAVMAATMPLEVVMRRMQVRPADRACVFAATASNFCLETMNKFQDSPILPMAPAVRSPVVMDGAAFRGLSHCLLSALLTHEPMIGPPSESAQKLKR